MTATIIVLTVDVFGALMFTGMIASVSSDEPSRMQHLRRVVYLIVALVCGWRSYDIVMSWHLITDVEAIFNVTMVCALAILAYARRIYCLP